MEHFNYPGNLEYEFSVHVRVSYLDDAPEEGYFGALDYAGEHCVVSGYRPDELYGTDKFTTIVYRVNDGSLAEAAGAYGKRAIESVFTSNDSAEIRDRHAYHLRALSVTGE